VLIVDDDPAVRQLLEDAIVKQGCETTVAENGKKALEELEKQRFDLIFLDLVLPELNGLAVLRSIRASGNRMGVAVITGYGDDPIALEAMSLGPMFFIRKPFKIADVIEVINATQGVKR
jgi:DNA-binding NtrC family response regulator